MFNSISTVPMSCIFTTDKKSGVFINLGTNVYLHINLEKRHHVQAKDFFITLKMRKNDNEHRT